MVFRRILAIQLALGLAVPLFPQSRQELPGAGGRNRPLKIFVLEGEGAINDIQKGASTPPVVEVRDQNDQPVEGATVTFELPPGGPSGSFPDGKLTLAVRTNAQGQAGATGFAPNNQEGRFKIKIVATFGERTGTTYIEQTNSKNKFAAETHPHKSPSKKWWIIGGIVVAAGVTAGVLATRGSSSSSNTPIVIGASPGPIVIGGPK